MVNWGPKFTSNKSLAATYWQGILIYSVYWEEPKVELFLDFPQYALIVYAIWVNHCRDTLVLSFYHWTEICPIWSELQTLDILYT